MRMPGAEEREKMAKPPAHRSPRRWLVPDRTDFVRHRVLSRWRPPRRPCRRHPQFSFSLHAARLPAQKYARRIAPLLRFPQPSAPGRATAELISFAPSHPWTRLRCASVSTRTAKRPSIAELSAVSMLWRHGPVSAQPAAEFAARFAVLFATPREAHKPYERSHHPRDSALSLWLVPRVSLANESRES